MFQMWRVWALATRVSFKLQRASPGGDSRLAGKLLSHQPITMWATEEATSKISALPQVEGTLEMRETKFLLDSGAAVSVVRYDQLTEKSKKEIVPGMTAVGADGNPLEVLGCVTLPISIGEYRTMHKFVVMRRLATECLLGTDFLTKSEAVLDCHRKELRIGSDQTVPIVGAERCQRGGCFVVVSSTIEIPSRAIYHITGKLTDHWQAEEGCTGVVEPIASAGLPKHLLVARSLGCVNMNGEIAMQIMNTDQKTADPHKTLLPNLPFQ